MSDERGPLTYAMDRESAGVVVWFENTAYAFTKSGAPSQLNYRNKVILRALLDAAIADLDAS